MNPTFSEHSGKDGTVRGDSWHVKTHGAKLSEASKIFFGKPIEEQCEQLNSYQGFRDEPVPPDPTITSAVKVKHAVPVKSSQRAGACCADMGKPLISGHQKPQLQASWYKNQDLQKIKAEIPIFRGLTDEVALKIENVLE